MIIIYIVEISNNFFIYNSYEGLMNIFYIKKKENVRLIENVHFVMINLR